ncbi:MAG: DUF790 family protein [Planctomycetota bacterium]
MLTVDHVLARVREGKLALTKLHPRMLTRAAEIARGYCDAARACAGATRAEFRARCAEIDVEPQERRVALGLEKLVTDRCKFEPEADVDPPALRRTVFARAAEMRRGLGAEAELAREEVLAELGPAQGCDPERLDALLYSDLKDAHRLVAFTPTPPDQVVADWRRGQAQAVLLRATGVEVMVHNDEPSAYRALFHKLKFLRLMYHLAAQEDGGYRIAIDGPFSLFRSVTKYGLQLALLLPSLERCRRFELRADVLWGPQRRPVTFAIDGGRDQAEACPVRLPDEVATLVQQFERLRSDWRAAPATCLLDLQGVGLCVPDLTFVHGSGAHVHLEVMGYWSRDAVWRRVELVEAGLGEPIVFCVSQRLRVSEAVLDDAVPAALYVYKGVMSAKAVLAKLEAIRGRA